LSRGASQPDRAHAYAGTGALLRAAMRQRPGCFRPAAN